MREKIAAILEMLAAISLFVGAAILLDLAWGSEEVILRVQELLIKTFGG